MGNSYLVVKEMRPIPFGTDVVISLVVVTVLPIIPLFFTVVPLETVVDRLLKVLL